MSVNLSMCMNVDVTTHDQLLHPQRGGHVVGRHALNSTTQQYRDDPWTRYSYTLQCVELVKYFCRRIVKKINSLPNLSWLWLVYKAMNGLSPQHLANDWQLRFILFLFFFILVSC